MKLYKEKSDAGNDFRKNMLSEVKHLVVKKQCEADRRRKNYFRPDKSSIAKYENSLSPYRKALINMLGWPLTEGWSTEVPKATIDPIAKDDLGTISRVFIETLPGVHTYGLFFLPKARKPLPLVIVQHGGQGTPELCSDFFWISEL